MHVFLFPFRQSWLIQCSDEWAERSKIVREEALANSASRKKAANSHPPLRTPHRLAPACYYRLQKEGAAQVTVRGILPQHHSLKSSYTLPLPNSFCVYGRAESAALSSD